MANGGLRINKPLRERRAEGEQMRRAAQKIRRQQAREDKAVADRKSFLRDRGFVLPGEGIVLTD